MTLKPKRLKPQSKVILISPSGVVLQEKIEKAVDNIADLGEFMPVVPISEKQNFGFFADTDENRFGELMYSFDVQTDNAIVCIRGGYGATRLLPHIDFELIKNNPKIFMGFSDITALQSAFYVKTGLVSIHGIVGVSEFTDYIKKQLTDLIIQPVDNYTLPLKNFKTLNSGYAKGKIVGGNLAVLCSLIGTEYLYKFENNIVFLEDIFEPPYKIDRMFTQLLQATDISKAAAIVFGTFHRCDSKTHEINEDKSFTIEQIIRMNFSELKIPIIFDANFGHIKDSIIFPIGVNASINADNGEITLQEKAVL
jgi:muramoyltetrapeptide carboxypeptidase